MEIYSDRATSIGPAASELGRWSFRYPHEVVGDSQINMAEKRAILAAWASDKNAVESFPALRHLPGTPFPVTFSSVMDARLQLDKILNSQDDNPPPTSPQAKRMLRARLLAFRETA